MFQNGQKVVVVSSGDPTRVIKVQSASGTPDPSRYPIVDTTGVTGRDQQVQIVSGGDPTRFPILRGVSDARATADSVITALSPAAWYRNATGVTSAGGFASKWDDYSGNARHLVQATGTNQPAYAAGVMTGDGADNFLRTAAFTLDQPSTVVAIFRQDSWTLDDSVWDGATALNRRRLYTPGSTPNMTMYAGGVGPANTGATIGTWRVIKAFYNGASSTLNVDNGADSTGNAGTNTASGFTLFADGQATPVSYGAKSVAEVILFSGEIPAGDWTSLYNALDAIRDSL